MESILINLFTLRMLCNVASDELVTGYRWFFKYMFIFISIYYLAALHLSYGMQDLQSLLWHMISLVEACKLLVVACEI